MKYLLLLAIRIYWSLIPETNRRKCIFRKSCSNHVYDQTRNSGLKAGIEAFRFRYQNCRNGFVVFENPLTMKKQMILPNQQTIEQKEIAERLI